MIAWILSSSVAKRYRLTSAHVYMALLGSLLLIGGSLFLASHSGVVCPVNGPGSSAPLNEVDFMRNLEVGLKFVRGAGQNHSSVGGHQLNVVSTCINQEAAMHNFPAFMHSVASVQPPLTSLLLVFCLDELSCKTCRQQGLHAAQCIFMDLGVAGNSLAPGGVDKQDTDYWRLTYGRVFATVAMVRPGINVVPVDVDAVFLQNPFNPGNGIHERPNDIAVVADIAPFTFRYGDKTPINGGFLYFPGVTTSAYQYSKQVVDRIWARNCQPKSNEQLVTSSVLRYMSRQYATASDYHPHMLSVDQYLNFCSTDCGTGLEFASVGSLQDLRQLEAKWSGAEGFKKCDAEARKRWVYFHAACLNKDVLADKNAVAKAKGAIQRAVYEWVKTGA
jgi:hypothetical protein